MFKRSTPPDSPAPVTPEPAASSTQRKLFRVKPLNAEEVAVRLVVPGAFSVDAELNDLALAGAGVRIPFQHDPCLEEGALLEVRLEHRQDDWVVDSPARVVHKRQAGDLHVLYGLEFVNLGNLYGQMDDAWAHYFNRRVEPHFGVDLDAPMQATLRQRQHRMDAMVTDLSRGGLCLRAAHHMASPFEVGERAELHFLAWNLPGEYVLEVTLQNRRTLGEWDYLGFKIADEQPPRCRDGFDVLMAYVDERERERAAREAELRDSAA